MSMITRANYKEEIDHNQKEIQKLVLQSINQIKQGKVKDFGEVCDRLEKKYTDEEI